MDRVTTNLADYIKRLGIPITTISNNVDIPYGVLYPSLSGNRALRATEYLKVCRFLDVDPSRFEDSA